MIDLYFADNKARANFDCHTCRTQKPFRAKKLACDEPGFDNCRPIAVDKSSTARPFCPGKARWYPEMQRVFEQCLIANQTGILPGNGGIDDQSDLFAECFGTFIGTYNWRRYNKIWADVGEYVPKVLEAVGKMFGGKKK